ncbi:hypothetical protein OTK51_18130 [Vibrio scophthalmi]|uniref:hypothetical protein n=1 Tax=Vibrio scophthalmi TaxID=45658 RepID=UPI002284A685|nr:hypothetical protein [Vibrio scophthalmi]MCY9805345.1 hypothetical protein [Vibrio scophthalmi]
MNNKINLNPNFAKTYFYLCYQLERLLLSENLPQTHSVVWLTHSLTRMVENWPGVQIDLAVASRLQFLVWFLCAEKELVKKASYLGGSSRIGLSTESIASRLRMHKEIKTAQDQDYLPF